MGRKGGAINSDPYGSSQARKIGPIDDSNADGLAPYGIEVLDTSSNAPITTAYPVRTSSSEALALDDLASFGAEQRGPPASGGDALKQALRDDIGRVLRDGTGQASNVSVGHSMVSIDIAHTGDQTTTEYLPAPSVATPSQLDSANPSEPSRWDTFKFGYLQSGAYRSVMEPPITPSEFSGRLAGMAVDSLVRFGKDAVGATDFQAARTSARSGDYGKATFQALSAFSKAGVTVFAFGATSARSLAATHTEILTANGANSARRAFSFGRRISYTAANRIN